MTPLYVIPDRRQHSTTYTIGDRAFQVSAAHTRKSLLQHVTSACLPVTFEDSPFYYFLTQSLTLYRVCACIILDTSIVHVSYLLANTYSVASLMALYKCDYYRI